MTSRRLAGAINTIQAEDNRRGQSRLEAQRRRRQRQAAQFDTSQNSSDSEGLDSSIADNSDVDVDFDSLSWENVRSKYEVDIRKGCTEVCVCCGCLHFEKNIRILSKDTIASWGCSQDLIDSIFQVAFAQDTEEETGQFCSTCWRT
ncbi:hypothetical protein, partial, partial [Parasitella parasitica]